MNSLPTIRDAHRAARSRMKANLHLTDIPEIKDYLVDELKQMRTVQQLADIGICSMRLLYEALNQLMEEDRVHEVISGHYRVAQPKTLMERVKQILTDQGPQTVYELEVACDCSNGGMRRAIKLLLDTDEVCRVGKKTDTWTHNPGTAFALQTPRPSACSPKQGRRPIGRSKQTVTQFLSKAGPSIRKQIAQATGLSDGHTYQILHGLIASGEVVCVPRGASSMTTSPGRTPKTYALACQTRSVTRKRSVSGEQYVKECLVTPKTIRQLEEKTGISRFQLYRYVKSLVEKGDVQAVGYQHRDGRGQRPMRYRARG